MVYLVYVGMLMPQHGPYLNYPFELYGVVEAPTVGKAAQLLGVLRWHGWKNVPGADRVNWKRKEKSFYFLPEDIQLVDADPTAHTALTVIRFQRTRKCTGKITRGQIWMK